MPEQTERDAIPSSIRQLGQTAYHTPNRINRFLRLAREHLDMDVAFASHFENGRQVYVAVDNGGKPAGIVEGEEISLEASYCEKVVAGQLPNVLPDTSIDPRVRDLPATETADVGSYVGIPLVFSDGRIYGTLCCISRNPDPKLAERDLTFIKLIARLLADQFERQELYATTWRLQVEAAGVAALVNALAARDGYTGEHSDAVVQLASSVAERLGFERDEVLKVRQAALLHDIGKIGVPDSVLRKEGPLDDAEWKIMRTHPVIGASIAETIPGIQQLAPILRAEHERWDGNGYPDGLAGNGIPFASRIVFACDAYHAMV
ncbi:MAG: GAF and HD-GYP domain-containing protein, partial [Actinomycetota bacterium]